MTPTPEGLPKLGITLFSLTLEMRRPDYSLEGMIRRVAELDLGPGLEVGERERLPVRLDRELGRVDRLAVDREVDDRERRERQRAIPVRVDLERQTVLRRGQRVVANYVLVERSHAAPLIRIRVRIRVW